jgi:hypothetical protein
MAGLRRPSSVLPAKNITLPAVEHELHAADPSLSAHSNVPHAVAAVSDDL